MSYQEAKRDGIPMGKDNRGFTAYYPPCHICGQRVESWNYIPANRYTCCLCKTLRRKKDGKDEHNAI